MSNMSRYPFSWIPFSNGYMAGQREIIFLVIKDETGNSEQCTGLLFSFYEKAI